MREYANRREIRLVGMPRSGNHAIIQWILAQSAGRYCFLHAVQVNSNRFLTSQPLHDPAGSGAIVNYAGFNLWREQAGRFTPKDLLLYSHEDEFLGRVGTENFERYHDGFEPVRGDLRRRTGHADAGTRR
ncbi:MAG: hypothetical protein AMXMBFR13_35210 [Phycisphaerae bacterium]